MNTISEFSNNPIILPHQFVGWFFEPDNLLGWKMIAGQKGWYVRPEFRTWITINQNGFRGKPFPSQKEANDFYILLLADSFGVALEVAENKSFAAVMEDGINKHLHTSKKKITVLNASVGGYGTEQEYLYLKSRGVSLKPDLIILAFHYGDDIIENSKNLCRRVGWRLVKLPRPYLNRNMELENAPLQKDIELSWAHYYDALPKELLFQKITTHKTNVKQGISITKNIIGKYRRQWQKFRQFWFVPIEYMVYHTQPDQDFLQAWDHTENLLRSMHQIASDINAEFLVTGICTKAQVIPSYLKQKTRAKKTGAFDSMYPNHRLAEILKNIGIDHIDLTPSFIKANQEAKQLFYNQDLHWNEKGHELAGQLLAEKVSKFIPNETSK